MSTQLTSKFSVVSALEWARWGLTLAPSHPGIQAGAGLLRLMVDCTRPAVLQHFLQMKSYLHEHVVKLERSWLRSCPGAHLGRPPQLNPGKPRLQERAGKSLDPPNSEAPAHMRPNDFLAW